MSSLLQRVAKKLGHDLDFPGKVEPHDNVEPVDSSEFIVYTCNKCGTRFGLFTTRFGLFTDKRAANTGIWQLRRVGVVADFYWEDENIPKQGMANSLSELLCCKDTIVRDIIE